MWLIAHRDLNARDQIRSDGMILDVDRGMLVSRSRTSGERRRDTTSIDHRAQSSWMLAGPARMDISVPIHTFRQQMITMDEVLPSMREHCATDANVPHRTAVWTPRTRLAGPSRVILAKYYS